MVVKLRMQAGCRVAARDGGATVRCAAGAGVARFWRCWMSVRKAAYDNDRPWRKPLRFPG